MLGNFARGFHIYIVANQVLCAKDAFVVYPPASKLLKSVKKSKNFSCLSEASLKNFLILTAFYKRGRRSFASFSAVRKAEKSLTSFFFLIPCDYNLIRVRGDTHEKEK